METVVGVCGAVGYGVGYGGYGCRYLCWVYRQSLGWPAGPLYLGWFVIAMCRSFSREFSGHGISCTQVPLGCNPRLRID